MRCECCVDVGHDLGALGKRWWRKHSDRNYASNAYTVRKEVAGVQRAAATRDSKHRVD
jgi:hypothetical protein